MPPSSPPTPPPRVLDVHAFGKRLAEARENAQLTQERVAEELGLPRSAIAQMEAGNRSVSSDELFRLAQLYGRPLMYFFEESPSKKDEDPLVVLGRMAPELEKDPETNRAIRRVVEICEKGMELERRLGKKPRTGPPAYTVAAPRNVGQAIEQGTRAADQERQRLGLGDAPIADIHELIATQGVWAASDHLPDDAISGLFINHPSTAMVTLVNHKHHRCRQRFSYAHEYAHALFDRDLTVALTSQGNAKDLSEYRANAFAAAFLMPKRGVESALDSRDKGKPSKQLFETYDVAGDRGAETAEIRALPGSQRLTVKDVAQIAILFDVSYPAACYRLRNLGFVKAPELKELLERDSSGTLFIRLATGHRDQAHEEKNSAQHIVSQVLPLVVEAHQRGEITRGRLLELSSLLSVSGPDVLEVAQAQ
ncbi:MAG: ImmA/IrrE family metallo-endopeptidase [Phycisphaerae bacterium]|nr:ImmA/IrrE family metallo-endopeptidase [Phycisphaerae bacterium]